MPPKSPQPSYTNKPVRRLRLPKLGPPKDKSFFAEYFYACLGGLFLAVAILCWAGGMRGFDALVLGAWVAAAVWSGRLLMGYYEEKEKTKERERAAAKEPETGNGRKVLPPGMKPMIGIQWPVKSGAWPARPGLKTAPSIPPTPAQNGQASTTSPPPVAPPPGSPAPGLAPEAPGNASPKPGFRYERTTLPDRKTKLPYNWPGQKDKKPKR